MRIVVDAAHPCLNLRAQDVPNVELGDVIGDLAIGRDVATARGRGLRSHEGLSRSIFEMLEIRTGRIGRVNRKRAWQHLKEVTSDVGYACAI